MTKKDYRVIAKALRISRQKDLRNYSTYTKEDVKEIFTAIIHRIMVELAENNMRFDTQKFLDYINQE